MSVHTVRNYGRNLEFNPREVAKPRTVEALISVVKAAKHVRPVGAAHSWSAAIVTDDVLVSLDEMRAPIKVDRDRMQVTVQAGMRLHDFNRYLDQQGLALANLGSIDRQSLAGVIATGTHGTGAQFRCISAQVAAIELVDPQGNCRQIARGDADFDGAIVSLGALGVVHTLTFDVVNAFQLHDRTATAPFDDVIDNLESYLAESDHFKFWWMPPSDDVITYRFRRTNDPANDSAVRRFLKERVLSVMVYRSLVAVGHWSGRRWIPAINRQLTREAGRPLERISKSFTGFLTPDPPVHRETEWAFDLRDAKPLLREYRKLLPSEGHTYNFIQEVRFSKADDLWLSPAFQRDTMWLGLYNMDPTNWNAQLAKFESFARANGGRPHWGKEAAFERSYLQTQYSKLEDFAQLVKRYDPERKMRNRWLDQWVG